MSETDWTGTLAVSRWRTLGTSALLLVAEAEPASGIDHAGDAQTLACARVAADGEIDAIDRACSRFRDDSELQLVNARAGHAVIVSATFAEALELALRAAELTDGRVDPTLGSDLRALGYDRDFACVPPDGPARLIHVAKHGTWDAIAFDRSTSTVTVPVGVELDFGATAKALAADRAAAAAAQASGRGVLVSLGGDIAVAGPAPSDGWSIRVTDDHAAVDDDGVDIAIWAGGLATSSTTVRRWQRGGDERHHILDPATGRPAIGPWRTVSVAAGSCADANLATTAALVIGPRAPEWLAARGLPARLVAHDGTVEVVAGWPADDDSEADRR